MAGADFHCYALRTAEGASLARPLLCVPTANRHLGWLVAPDGSSVEIPGEDTTGLAITVRLEYRFPSDMVALQHALRRRFLLSHNADQQDASRQLGFRHLAQDGRQDFRLDPTEPWQLNGTVLDLAAELSAAVTAPCRFAVLLEALRQGSVRAELADPVLRCLPPDELEHLARHLLENRADLALLQAVMPDNLWLRRRLPLLIAWRDACMRAVPPAIIPGREPSGDLAGAGGTTKHAVSVGLIVNAYARAATHARRTACVLATAQNEGAYLLDWIAYQRSIGFEHVFLYTNGNTDGSDDLLQMLSDGGVITWFENKMQPETLPQHRAYGHALSVMPDILDFRWTMVADIDEFASFDSGIFGGIADYLAWQEQLRADAVALPWKTYIAAKDDVWHDAPCIERFPVRDSALSSYVKMIFRTNKAWSANPHHPEPIFATGLVHRSESGEAHVQKTTPAQTARPTARLAWMSHYPFKSAPEMIMKLASGRPGQPPAVLDVAVENQIKTFLSQLQDTTRMEDKGTIACGARQAEERARLLDLPGLAACEVDIKRAYAKRMRAACAAFVEDHVESDAPHIKTLCTLLQKSLSAHQATIDRRTG